MALEQREAEPAFQRGDFTAYRPLRQTKLLRGMGKIQVTRGHDERLYGIKWK